MAYFANQPIQYNGVNYRVGEEIPDFGIGKYDDILLESNQVGSDGQGTGVEEKIAHQKERRLATMINPEQMLAEEEKWQADVIREQAERDVRV